MTGSVNMVVALSMEAKPIVRQFHLELKETSPFRVYTNAKKNIWCIVSGVGKILAGAATAWLASISGVTSNTSWLNIGVAGHKSLPIGTLVIANKITDDSSGQSWTLPQTLDQKIHALPILTLDKEFHNYPDDEACEMEAAGFYQIATRYSSQEFIHCLKVISDNKENIKIHYGIVEKLIWQNISTIHSFVSQLFKLTDSGSSPDMLT